MLQSGHKALSYISGRVKLHSRLTKWVEYLQTFSFAYIHKDNKENVAIDAFSMRHIMLPTLNLNSLDFTLSMNFKKNIKISKRLLQTPKVITHIYYTMAFSLRTTCDVYLDPLGKIYVRTSFWVYQGPKGDMILLWL